jgi:hypothetical protein
MDERRYVVIEDVGYYDGDVQHPSGWQLSVASLTDNGDEIDCIGTLEECEGWLEDLNDEPTYLGHGQASKSYRIAEILDDDADYQGWLDGEDWDGCPSEDGSDYDANTAWAEDRAYQNDGILPIAANNSSRLLLIDLSPEV